VDLTRAGAAALDDADPLAVFRSRFAGTEDEGADRLIYLDGNSLGRLPRETPAALARVVEQQWGEGLVASWAGWIGEATRLGDALADGVLGARPGEVLVADSTSVNLYKLLVAGAQARPGQDVLVCTADDLPTDRYVVAGAAEARGMAVREIPADIDQGLDPVTLAAALDERVAVVVLSSVAYRSGALADLPAVTRLVHDAGALVLWDLSHAVGAVPVELGATGADLAVGCTLDFRTPDRVRLGPAPLYTRFVDVWDAMDRCRGLLESRAFELYPAVRRRVT
jgi:kynureninase